MRIISFVVVLPLSLLLCIYIPFSDSHLDCYPITPGGRHRNSTNPGMFKVGWRRLAVPVAADCLHIVSILPSSLDMDVSAQRAHTNITLSYGRIASHRFDLPALFVHKTCAIDISTNLPHPYNAQFTRQETAFYFWNPLKSMVRNIVNTCLNEPGVFYGGYKYLDGVDAGLTEEVRAGAFMTVMVLAARYPGIRENRMHIYHV